MPTPMEVDSDLAARASATPVVIRNPEELATADAGAHTVESMANRNDVTVNDVTVNVVQVGTTEETIETGIGFVDI